MIGKIKPEKTYEIGKGFNSSKVSSDYSVTFRINNKCNLECDYCHWHNGGNYDIKDIKDTIDKLYEFFEVRQFNLVTFYFHGGEPSFHPNIIQVLEYLRTKEIKTIIEFQTNLSLKSYKEIYDLVDVFDISYHYLELRDKNLLEMFKKNIHDLPKYKLNHLDIMLENVPHDELDFFYSEIKEYLELPFTNSEMIYGFCHYKYNDETQVKHMEFYNKYNKNEQIYYIDCKEYTTNDLFKDGLNCKGMNCNAGKETIVVNADGNVFICGIDMTNYTNRCEDTKPYTNLITDKMSVKKLTILSKTGYVCKWEYCGGDFYVPKEWK